MSRRETLDFARSLRASAFFQGGTLVLQHTDNIEHVPAPFQFVKSRWRCEAYRYHAVLPWMQEQGIRNAVPRWHRLALDLHDTRELHAYQVQALDAWKQASGRGSVVLPTGAGKTLVATHAIHHVSSSAVVIVPTMSLVYQWYALLTNAFQTEIGVYYSGEKRVLPLTVTTYHSAGDLIAEYGNTFKLLICDEVHHLPAKTWGEAALMAPAPYRLGLTATYPEEHEQTGDRWRLDALIGPIVFTQQLETLVGKQLAEYRTQRVRVDLTPEERASYDAAYATYLGFVRERGLQRTHGASWLRELMRLSTRDPLARRAWLARREILNLLESCQGKLAALEALLREHSGDRILVFTESNAVAYTIARKFLVPAITHETGVAERKHILDAFQKGHYHVIVTSKVLNEGVDVPEAKVAIVLGGGASKREYIQRLGRILRKKEPLQAVLIEVLVRQTIEEGKVQRRYVPRETADVDQ
ncbi:MAG TPA: DEAD/DEAH box helicase [Ktedonobacteraceae bacterium]